MYTLLYRAHELGESIIRPLIYDFNAKETFESVKNINTQFLVGKYVLVCPEETCFIPSGQESATTQIDYMIGFISDMTYPFLTFSAFE